MAGPVPLIAESPEALAELFDLIRGSDSVELKLTVPQSNRRSSVRALGMDPLEAEIRQVFFFDTPDLRCNQAGLIARARRVASGDDSVVKLRPVVPDDLPDDIRNSPDVKVEVDALPGGFVCSASYKGKLGVGRVKAVLDAGDPLRKLFSKEQRAFFKAHAPDGLALDDLTVLGPVNMLKLKFSPKGFDRRVVAELWLYPDGSSVLELSTKCLPGEAFQVSTEARMFLSKRGVDLTGEQATKTATALEQLSREVAATPA